jgi:hypothetical protein
MQSTDFVRGKGRGMQVEKSAMDLVSLEPKTFFTEGQQLNPRLPGLTGGSITEVTTKLT